MVAHPSSKRAKAAKVKRQQTRTANVSNDPKHLAVLAEREAEKARKRTSQKRRSVLRKLCTYAIFGLVVGILAIGGWLALRPGPELVGVERPQDNGRGHVTNASFATSTPTSGQHAAQSPGCGLYPTPLDLDLAVHALEHGAVVLWFDQSRPALGAELADLVEEWDSHVVVSPSNGLDAPIIATAWNRRLAYDSVTDGVVDFVDTYRKRGPERVNCDNA